MRSRKPTSLISSIIYTGTVFYTILLIIQLSISNLAFGDGLSQEQISASMGDRKADLLIKTTPRVVTTEALLTPNKSQLSNLGYLIQILTNHSIM